MTTKDGSDDGRRTARAVEVFGPDELTHPRTSLPRPEGVFKTLWIESLRFRSLARAFSSYRDAVQAQAALERAGAELSDARIEHARGQQRLRNIDAILAADQEQWERDRRLTTLGNEIAELRLHRAKAELLKDIAQLENSPHRQNDRSAADVMQERVRKAMAGITSYMEAMEKINGLRSEARDLARRLARDDNEYAYLLEELETLIDSEISRLKNDEGES